MDFRITLSFINTKNLINPMHAIFFKVASSPAAAVAWSFLTFLFGESPLKHAVQLPELYCTFLFFRMNLIFSKEPSFLKTGEDEASAQMGSSIYS